MGTAVVVGAGVFLVLAGLLAAELRWRRATASLVAKLRPGRGAQGAPPYSASELEGLPPPVRAYFQTALCEGRTLATRVELEQEGEFLIRAPDGWRPFRAQEIMTAEPPGFLWDARIRTMPGFTVRVRDGLVAGAGTMEASLLGLFRLAASTGAPDITAGALHRYLAEAVWMPAALLPRFGVVWSALDHTTARATFTAGPATVSLDFRFGQDGLVETVYTPARARNVAGVGVPTPWRGRWFEYGEWGGMRIPLRGEVAWVLPEGPQVYWRGRVTAVR